MTDPSKADVEQARAAEQDLDRARAEGKPLARDVLERFMLLFASLASRYQPGTTAAPNKFADNGQFRFWSERAVDAAKALAIYQSPRLQAVAVAAPPTTRRISLKIFDRDLTTMTDAGLVAHYRARIAAGPESAPESLEHVQRVPVAERPPEARPEPPTIEHEPQPVVEAEPEPVPAEQSVEPAASVAPPAPAAQPAAPPNVFRFPEAPKTVQEYADSIASAVGPDGRPRAVNAKAISQAALSRAAVPSTRNAGMPRRSGVFDR